MVNPIDIAGERRKRRRRKSGVMHGNWHRSLCVCFPSLWTMQECWFKSWNFFYFDLCSFLDSCGYTSLPFVWMTGWQPPGLIGSAYMVIHFIGVHCSTFCIGMHCSTPHGWQGDSLQCPVCKTICGELIVYTLLHLVVLAMWQHPVSNV